MFVNQSEWLYDMGKPQKYRVLSPKNDLAGSVEKGIAIRICYYLPIINRLADWRIAEAGSEVIHHLLQQLAASSQEEINTA